MNLHWLLAVVYYRILVKVLLLVFKALNGLATHHVSDLLNKRVSVRSLRSNSQELLLTFLGRELKLTAIELFR